MNTKIMLTVVTSLIATAVFALDPPPVGSAAPDFSLTDASGKTHSLSQYNGKTVVLEWFNRDRLEDASDRASSRSGRQSGSRVWSKEYAEYGNNYPGRKNRLRRRNRQQSHAEPRRYSDLDQLCQGRARRITHRQTGFESKDQAVRLLGKIQIVVKFPGRAPRECKCASLSRTSQ